jgi:hypothetical protein
VGKGSGSHGTPNESWMDLHRLAASLEEEGLTRQERLDNLVHEFLAMPPLVRREEIKKRPPKTA